jgi:hypothetical protein
MPDETPRATFECHARTRGFSGSAIIIAAETLLTLRLAPSMQFVLLAFHKVHSPAVECLSQAVNAVNNGLNTVEEHRGHERAARACPIAETYLSQRFSVEPQTRDSCGRGLRPTPDAIIGE